MNVKELSEFTGKAETTVRGWVRMASAKSAELTAKTAEATPNNPADFNIDDVELILSQSNLGANAVLIVMANARRGQESTPAIHDQSMLKILEQNNILMAEMIKIIKNSSAVTEEKKILLEAPKKNNRSELNQLVRQYAFDNFNGIVQNAWNVIYSELLYRIHRNVRVCANNLGMKKIDYLEKEGLIDTTISIVIELMGE